MRNIAAADLTRKVATDVATSDATDESVETHVWRSS